MLELIPSLMCISGITVKQHALSRLLKYTRVLVSNFQKWTNSCYLLFCTIVSHDHLSHLPFPFSLLKTPFASSMCYFPVVTFISLILTFSRQLHFYLPVQFNIRCTRLLFCILSWYPKVNCVSHELSSELYKKIFLSLLITKNLYFYFSSSKLLSFWIWKYRHLVWL